MEKEINEPATRKAKVNKEQQKLAQIPITKAESVVGDAV